ncbi:MAG TPA: AraC family transcriptional regulator [Candidatus Cloacimonadota bacterium]|nr:AraC family transcriptional regulator [Candidatus Cloacimonadota bacterium]
MDYSRQIQKALDFMEKKLADKLELEDIADIANFSMFHFHRLFVGLVGFTPMDYLRRRRLSEAARELIFNLRSINEIAGRYQFESQASFTRAFGKQFGISPGKIRKTKQPVDYFSPIDVNKEMRKQGVKKMDVKIVEKEAMKVIGMEVITTMKNNTIPQLWDRFNKVCCSINNVKVKNVALGICPPVNMKEFDENTPFSYIAGLIVENFDDVPKEMVTYEIPTQKYAVITHKGALDNLNETYKYFYSVWPKESGREFSGGAEFEWYDERFKWGDPASEIDIYRPIK